MRTIGPGDLMHAGEQLNLPDGRAFIVLRDAPVPDSEGLLEHLVKAGSLRKIGMSPSLPLPLRVPLRAPTPKKVRTGSKPSYRQRHKRHKKTQK